MRLSLKKLFLQSHSLQEDHEPSPLWARLLKANKAKGGSPEARSSADVELVSLYVGRSRRLFKIDKEVLCSKIPYFKSMFKGGFSEASTQSASFPEDDSTAFEILLWWVEHGEIRPMTSFSWSVVNFYTLADKLGLTELMDQTMDLYREAQLKADVLPHENIMKEIYERTREGSPLRKYVARSVQYLILENGDDDTWKTSTLVDLMMEERDLTRDVLALMRHQGGKEVQDPSDGDGCEFHHHGKARCPFKVKSKGKSNR